METWYILSKRERGFSACSLCKRSCVLIRVKNLTKYYGTHAAIKDVSFEVNKGEILGFLGPNAAGKTTTMRILTCFLPATFGEVNVAGYDTFSQPLQVRRMIGYLPENVPLYQDMRVEEYLSYRARLKEVPRGTIRKRLSYVLERCGVGNVKGRIIGQLSKGYRQRVGLAGALISDPPLLILDEPTIGLDPNHIRQVRSLIRELGGEHTILLSTHILPEVEMVCGRVIIIDRGKIVAMDTPSRLVERLEKGGVTISLAVRGPGKTICEKVKSLPGVAGGSWQEKGEISHYSVEMIPGKDEREEVSRTITENGGIIREMKTEEMSLEDVFVQITTSDSENREQKIGVRGQGTKSD